jgi:hypothetical protein
MYRKPKPSQLRRIEALKRGRDRANASKPARGYPPVLPDLRREVIVIDFDGPEPITHTLHLFKTRRVDMYRVEADGKPWKSCGWSAALAGLRKAYQRVPSPRSDFWRD